MMSRFQSMSIYERILFDAVGPLVANVRFFDLTCMHMFVDGYMILARVILEDGVFVHGGSLVEPGCTVGRGTVLRAGTVLPLGTAVNRVPHT